MGKDYDPEILFLKQKICKRMFIAPLAIIGNTRNNSTIINLSIVEQSFGKWYIQIMDYKWYIQKSGIYTAAFNHIAQSHRHNTM